MGPRIFVFGILLVHSQAFTSQSDRKGELTFEASMGQNIEKKQAPSINLSLPKKQAPSVNLSLPKKQTPFVNISLQITVSSDDSWPPKEANLQAVKEEIDQLMTNFLHFKNDFDSELYGNQNGMTWKAKLAVNRESHETKMQYNVENIVRSFGEVKTVSGKVLSTGHVLRNIQIGKDDSFADSLENDQSNQSGCDALKGKCQNDSLQCTGSYVIGKCPGSSNIKCCTNNITLQDTKTCRNVPIYSRDSWGARRPISRANLSIPVGMFFIHHTDTSTCTEADGCAKILRSIQKFHMETRKWEDIAYSFLVGQDGRVYEGRGWQTVGAHTLHYNSRSLAVSVMGNFTGVVPNSQALRAVGDLLACGTAQGYLTGGYSLYGHRDVRDTECPGDAFYNLIRTWPHYNTTTDKDGGCLAKHGICKPNYLPCSGQFVKGLCNGYSKRQCCVP